jgi:hypothetical protein
MQKELHKSMAERVEQFKLFYNKKNERPLFGFFYGSEYPIFRYPFAAKLPENKALTPDDFNVDSFVADTVKLFETHETCGGDFIYSASAFWGIPWLEAMLGCPVYSDIKTGALYAEKPETVNLKFSADDEWSVLMKKMLKALAKASDGQFPLATTRMRGVSDLLNAIYGGDEFLFKLMGEPDEMRPVIAQLADFFIDAVKFQLELIPEFYGGIGSFYYHNWAPAGTVWHQEDAAALLSPDLYDDFIEPADRKIVESLPQVIMHQHSTGYVPTGAYIKMGMFALELHIDTGGPSAEELYDRHLNILNNKPLIIWGDIPEADLDWIFSKLPPQGLAVTTVVDSSEQARQLWSKYVEKNT